MAEKRLTTSDCHPRLLGRRTGLPTQGGFRVHHVPC